MKSDFICQYHGEQLSEKDEENRKENYQDKDGNFVYFFEHDGQKLWYVPVEIFNFIDCSIYYCIYYVYTIEIVVSTENYFYEKYFKMLLSKACFSDSRVLHFLFCLGLLAKLI